MVDNGRQTFFFFLGFGWRGLSTALLADGPQRPPFFLLLPLVGPLFFLCRTDKSPSTAGGAMPFPGPVGANFGRSCRGGLDVFRRAVFAALHLQIVVLGGAICLGRASLSVPARTPRGLVPSLQRLGAASDGLLQTLAFFLGPLQACRTWTLSVSAHSCRGSFFFLFSATFRRTGRLWRHFPWGAAPLE